MTKTDGMCHSPMKMLVYYRWRIMNQSSGLCHDRSKNDISLHHKSWAEKIAKILFQIFHSLLAMKSTVTNTCVLTTRILTVKVSVVQFFLSFYGQECNDGGPIWKPNLANKPK